MSHDEKSLERDGQFQEYHECCQASGAECVRPEQVAQIMLGSKQCEFGEVDQREEQVEYLGKSVSRYVLVDVISELGTIAENHHVYDVADDSKQADEGKNICANKFFSLQQFKCYIC